MASALRSLLLASFVCGVTALLAPGCSQQGEGERCDKVKAQNSDCDGDLVCIPKAQLLDASTDRCCPATVGDESDDRCRRSSGSSNGNGNGDGGSSDTGEQPSGGGEAGAVSSGGAAGVSSVPDAGGNGGASEEPSPNAGAPSAGGPSDGGAPAAAGASGAGGA